MSLVSCSKGSLLLVVIFLGKRDLGLTVPCGAAGSWHSCYCWAGILTSLGQGGGAGSSVDNEPSSKSVFVILQRV